MTAGDFRNGITIKLDSNLYTVIEFQHVKPGKGAAFVRTKLKNIISGGVIEKTFRPTEKILRAYIDQRKMIYLYRDNDLVYFMDEKTYEQVYYNVKTIGQNLKFIKENEIVKIMSYNENLVGIEIPLTVELKIIETEPGLKGDTATNVMKQAKLETGSIINVPLFINIDDIVKIDTRTGEYIGRA
jgi:elongation factor P